MSKKLIAVAAAAALALTGLVAAPAGATAITNVVINHGNNVDQTNTASHTNSDAAVAANTAATSRLVQFSDTATRTAVRFTVNTAAAAPSVAVTTTGGVKVSATLVDGAGAALKVDAGSQSLNGSTTAGTPSYVFYAWNTSTTPGQVTIDTGTSKMTFWVKGTIYNAYNITSVTYPSTLTAGTATSKVTFKLTDPFGNEISSASTGLALSGFGATFGTPTYSSVTKLWSSVITVGATSTNVAVNLELTAPDLSDNGFAKPVTSSFKLISAGDLAAQVTSLTAQVATLQASVTALTAEYNKVAKKYNKLVKKSKRVALK